MFDTRFQFHACSSSSSLIFGAACCHCCRRCSCLMLVFTFVLVVVLPINSSVIPHFSPLHLCKNASQNHESFRFEVSQEVKLQPPRQYIVNSRRVSLHRNAKSDSRGGRRIRRAECSRCNTALSSNSFRSQSLSRVDVMFDAFY